MSPPSDPRSSSQPPDAIPVVLLVDVDPPLASLFGEWLADCGLQATPSAPAGQPIELAVVDLPYPRQGSRQRLKEIAARFPDTPLVAVAPTCCPGVAESGNAARELGVDAVIPAPVRREALLAAVAEVRRKKA